MTHEYSILVLRLGEPEVRGGLRCSAVGLWAGLLTSLGLRILTYNVGAAHFRDCPGTVLGAGETAASEACEGHGLGEPVWF